MPYFLDEIILLLGVSASYIFIIIYYSSIKNNLGNIYQASQQEQWQGLYLNDVSVTLPSEYDFTGSGNQIKLNKGDLALSEAGAWGTFKKENFLTFLVKHKF